MRHRVKGSRLNMRVGHRNSQRRTQVRQLFEYERIQTTVAKAKSIQPDAERLITIAKNALKGDDIAQVNGRRRVAAYLGTTALKSSKNCLMTSHRVLQIDQVVIHVCSKPDRARAIMLKWRS